MRHPRTGLFAKRAILESMLNIRPATPNDIPEILKIIRELAEHEKAQQVAVAAPRPSLMSSRVLLHVPAILC